MGYPSIVFLLGAGFNADASAEAQYPSGHSYPSAIALAKICFGLEALPAGSSIEDLFANALQARRPEPLRALCKVLMEADHHVALHLRADTNIKDNAYIAFLRRFNLSTFLTFNYDSLLEILLLSLNRWRPDDGYGLQVKVELPPYPPPLPASSTNLVLHLHGVLTVYPQEFRIQGHGQQPIPMLENREEPIFIFDPDVLADAFFPFRRGWPETSFSYPDERIIAPIPDKAPELTKAFVNRAYNRRNRRRRNRGRT